MELGFAALENDDGAVAADGTFFGRRRRFGQRGVREALE